MQIYCTSRNIRTTLQFFRVWYILWLKGSDEMKIEKISDNKIRCILTSEDLSSRNIRLSELAYGSDKSRKLFQDMMREAHYEVGFDSGNSPLMIEAIPTSSESLTLIITKVEDPEELDTRFSKFTQPTASLGDGLFSDSTGGDAATLAELFDRLFEARRKDTGDTGKSVAAKDAAGNKTDASPATETADSRRSKLNDMLPKKLIQVFQFRSLDDVISASKAVHNFYRGSNSLYKTEAEQNNYELILHQSGMSPVDFYRTCNILSEYGTCSTVDEAGEAFLREHGTSLISSNALYRLSQL